MTNFDSESIIKRGEYLPHWTVDRAQYHVCFRLHDSFPNTVLECYKLERAAIITNAKSACKELGENEIIRIQWLFSSKVDRYLDQGRGKCYMKDAKIAEIVASVLQYFDNIRYFLHVWAVMPNHVHVVVEPFLGFDLFKIVHSWKSFSANQINKELGLRGKLWHSDAYNHIIRSQKSYEFLVEYVWSNPDRAGLSDWRYRHRRDSDSKKF